MSARPKVALGDRFDRLVVERLYREGGYGRADVRCDCGGAKTVYAHNLTNGATRSCGCLSRESNHARATHGRYGTPEYIAWQNIVQRCTNEGHPGFKGYGARGVYICARWRASFEAFFTDMGERPAGLTIDRIDNGGSYTCGRHDLCDDCRAKNAPANCRWTTQREQARNMRSNVWLEANGERMVAADYRRRFGYAALRKARAALTAEPRRAA